MFVPDEKALGQGWTMDESIMTKNFNSDRDADTMVIFPCTKQGPFLHLLGTYVHLPSFRYLRGMDLEWLAQLSRGMQIAASASGCRRVKIFFHKTPSVMHLHLHAIDAQHYENRKDDMTFH